MPIAALNGETVKLLKSTQVVSNIWSVVKELVENSLDAGARSVEVYLTDNGVSSIKVRDDGMGISKEDATLMGLASYTSKMSTVKDLESLTSYGFRGVALHSVCNLANVTVTTKTENDQVAAIYTLDHNGNIEKTDYSHGNNGTTVEVKDFCKRFPVRRKILSESKSLKKDLKNVEILIKDFSICNPEVRFLLQINNKLIFTKPVAKDLNQALSHVISYKNVLNLHQINFSNAEMKIDLMVPKKDATNFPDLFKSGQSYIFINKRPIKHKEFEQIILKKIVEYFSTKLTNVKKSLFVLNINMNPADVDVNLEPNKDKVIVNNMEKVIDQLDEILSSYYGLEMSQKEEPNKENEENEASKSFENPDESHVADESFVFVNKRARSEERIVKKPGVEARKKKCELNEKPMRPLEETMKPLCLSESDSDGETKQRLRKSKSPCLETIPEKLSSEEIKKRMKEYDENVTLSQLPLVNMGEDFDLSILEDNEKMIRYAEGEEPVKSKEPAAKVEIGSDAWSRGQIPGGSNVKIAPVNFVPLEKTARTPDSKRTPKSAFGIFQSEKLSQMMRDKPDAKEAEIARSITQQWNGLSREERGYYTDLAVQEMNATLTPKPSRSQKRPSECEDPQANKKKLIKLLENMKRDNKSEPAKIAKKKTILWNVTLQGVTSSFRRGQDVRKSKDKLAVIGHADNEDFWFVKRDGSNWLLNVPLLLKKSKMEDVSGKQVNANVLKQLLEQKLEESGVDDVLHHIHDL